MGDDLGSQSKASLPVSALARRSACVHAFKDIFSTLQVGALRSVPGEFPRDLARLLSTKLLALVSQGLAQFGPRPLSLPVLMPEGNMGWRAVCAHWGDCAGLRPSRQVWPPSRSAWYMLSASSHTPHKHLEGRSSVRVSLSAFRMLSAPAAGVNNLT